MQKQLLSKNANPSGQLHKNRFAVKNAKTVQIKYTLLVIAVSIAIDILRVFSALGASTKATRKNLHLLNLPLPRLLSPKSLFASSSFSSLADFYLLAYVMCVRECANATTTKNRLDTACDQQNGTSECQPFRTPSRDSSAAVVTSRFALSAFCLHTQTNQLSARAFGQLRGDIGAVCEQRRRASALGKATNKKKVVNLCLRNKEGNISRVEGEKNRSKQECQPFQGLRGQQMATANGRAHVLQDCKNRKHHMRRMDLH